MTVIDDSDNNDTASAVNVLSNPVDMGDSAPGPVLPASVNIEARGIVDVGNFLCGDVPTDACKVCDYVQTRVRTKFLWSSIASVHVFRGEVTVLRVEGQQ